MNARRRVGGLTLLAAVFVGSACASSGRDPFDPSQTEEAEGVTLTVENQNYSDGTLYTTWDTGVRRRLGMITGLATRAFDLEVRGVRLHVEVDFIAGGTYALGSVLVSPGDDLRITIPPG